MAESLRGLLEKHRWQAGNTEYVFDRTHWMVRDCHNHGLTKLCRKVGIKPFGFHGIRDLAASIGVEGASTADVQQLLRHKSLTTTARYIHRTRNNNATVKVLNDAFRDRHGLFE